MQLLVPVQELLNLQSTEAKPAETQADTGMMEDSPERRELPGTALAKESRNPRDACTTARRDRVGSSPGD